MKRYAKTAVVFIGNIAATIVASTGFDSNSHKIAAGIIALLTILGVYQIKNKD